MNVCLYYNEKKEIVALTELSLARFLSQHEIDWLIASYGIELIGITYLPFVIN